MTSRPWRRYVRRKKSDTFHWATNCSNFPKGKTDGTDPRVVIADRPYPPRFQHFEGCNQCYAKTKAGTAKFLPFHPPHYDPTAA